MREFFRKSNFRQDAIDIIDYCNDVICDYMADGLRLTLRQLYYQLVSANRIPNTERSYKNLGSIVSRARLSGMMDWDAIEDRVRVPRVHYDWSSVESIVRAALRQFRKPRLDGQESYLELWVEKDALAGVLSPIADDYHITLMVNRGYSSQSAMYESAQRIKNGVLRNGCQYATILYLGDLDPSGEDMVRDINDRLTMFLDTDDEYLSIEVTKVALNMEQVKEYSLPPNPAKLSDSRSKAFVAKYGTQSWEVDALPPSVLREIICEEIELRMDMKKYNKIILQENEERESVLAAVKELWGE